MVGSMLFTRQLGNFMSTKKKSGSEQSMDYAEMLEDDEESFYEEIIVDEDGEEYIEEVIEDEHATNMKSLSDLRATQEQVDSMSFQNAKRYLRALPQAKGPTSAPIRYADEDYEYEEIEIVDTITPIRRSRRSTFFEPPALDDILEGSEHTERSGASSLLQSPSVSKHKQAITRNLSNISEGMETSHNCSGELPPPAPSLISSQDEIPITQQTEIPVIKSPKDPEGDKIDEIVEGKKTSQAIEESGHPVVGAILVGELNDTSTKQDPIPISPIIKPSVSGRSINRSNKSIQSEATETTMSESGSNTSLDIRHVFGLVTPPGSPHPAPVSNTRRSGTPTQLGTSHRESNSSLGRNLKGLEDSGHSNGRRSSGSARRREEGDNHSVSSCRSRRSSRRSSGNKSLKGTEQRAQSVEAEIMALLSPQQKTSSLDAMLSSPLPKDHRDSDDRSRSTRSRRTSSSRRHSSSKVHPSDKSHRTLDNKDDHDNVEKKMHGRSDGRSHRSSEPSTIEKTNSATKKTVSSTKDVMFKDKPTLREGSKTLDALLARVPSEPKKRSDARSTVSALIRSSRGRTRDSDRDCRSVVGGSSTQRPPRARSARRTKKGDDDELSVASLSAVGTRTRARSTSLGRKERLRRSRRKEEADRANRKHKEEMEAADATIALHEEVLSSRRTTSDTHRSSGISHEKDNFLSTNQDECDEISSSLRKDKDEISSSRRKDKDDISSSRRYEKNDISSSNRSNPETPRPLSERSTPSRDSSSKASKVEDASIELGASRGSFSKDSSTSRMRGKEGKSKSENTHGHTSRSSVRRSTNSTSNDSHTAERRSSNRMEDSMDDMDGNASFHRTLLLARSLHSSDDGSVSNDKKQVLNVASPVPYKETMKGSRRTTKSSSDSSHDSLLKTPRPPRRSETGDVKLAGDHIRTSKGRTLITDDDDLLVDPLHDSERQHVRLSDVANAMRETPKTPTTAREHRREPLSKKHSSDDILLMSPDDLDCTRTPSGRKHRTIPSRSQSSRTSSGSSRQERRVPYHSPQTTRKTLVSPSPDDHGRMHLARSRSERTPKPESPTKTVQMRHRRRTSEIQPISPLQPFSSPQSSDFHSPTSSTISPADARVGVKPMRRSSMDMHSPSSSASPIATSIRARRRSSIDLQSPSSASSSSSPRRGSMESRSSGPPLAPSLTSGLTPFERLSELEKIKQFLTTEEYEHKKQEILACI